MKSSSSVRRIINSRKIMSSNCKDDILGSKPFFWCVCVYIYIYSLLLITNKYTLYSSHWWHLLATTNPCSSIAQYFSKAMRYLKCPPLGPPYPFGFRLFRTSSIHSEKSGFFLLRHLKVGIDRLCIPYLWSPSMQYPGN